MNDASLLAVDPVHEKAIRAARPDLDGAPRVVRSDGWDSLAIEVAGRVIFKFPKNEAARERLLMEPPALDFIAPHIPVRVPRMRLHERPIFFSEHDKIEGAQIDPETYERLDSATRDRLAATLAEVYRAAHALDVDAARAAGCVPVEVWPGVDAIRAAIAPHFEPELMAYADTVLDAAREDDGDVTVFGHFDTHGWNMAFDLESGRLDGLFDFAGSGYGGLHRDLSYPAFVHPDLVARILARYAPGAPHPIDLDRVINTNAQLRLYDVMRASEAERPRVVELVREWRKTYDTWRAAPAVG
ncbi:phosphotransferase family protein [Acuticoccus kandeliae]|uniref:phosphotransferase family protein n=1 Tax=Acuticoccus kandeliae TaxID=2073160 RepID=UPI000D3EA6F0|nr:phosphotransferase [Acuticoccus kandeliae]